MIHTFHLAEVPASVGARALTRPPGHDGPAGLDHAESMSLMRLGAPTISTDRLQLRRLAVFAQWRDEAAVDRFMERDPLGRALAQGWHVRLEFLRRWSTLAALPGRRRHGRARTSRLPPRVRDVPLPTGLRARRLGGADRHRAASRLTRTRAWTRATG